MIKVEDEQLWPYWIQTLLHMTWTTEIRYLSLLEMISSITTKSFRPAGPLKDDKIDKTIWKNLAMRTLHLLSRILYRIKFAFEEKPHDRPSFFRRSTYGKWILIGIQANVRRMVACLLEIDAGPRLANKWFLSWKWSNQNEPPDYPDLQNATKQTVLIGSIIPILVRIRDLCTHAWLGVVENWTLKLSFGPFSIKRYLRGIFPSAHNKVQAHYHQVL